MDKKTKEKFESNKFYSNLPGSFRFPDDQVGWKMLKEYGAMFVAKGVVPPDVVIFKNEPEVAGWQSSVEIRREKIGGLELELQAEAMNALVKAVAEAGRSSLTITPRGEDAARRNFSGTVDLWASRVNPGLSHWVRNGNLSETEAERIRSLSPSSQIAEIFRLEEQGMYFAKDLTKSIIYSVAPPGTSQHLSMLALDVAEFEDQRVRETLARHGWFQTVVSDLPHFTYLGVKEEELVQMGLKKIENEGRAFWVPDL